MFLTRWLKSLPIGFLRNVLVLVVVGILFIYSATFRNESDYAWRQTYWFMISLVFFFASVRLGYRFFLGISYTLYLVSILLLAWVFLAGEIRLGAQRWITIAGVSIQPSEFAKVATVLALTHFLGSRNPVEGEGKAILGTLTLLSLPTILIMKQPDLGSAMLLVPMGVVLLFLWGIRYRYLIMTLVGGLCATPFLWHFLKEYQKRRILVFIDPQRDPLGSGYTAIQSKIAVGSGGLFGKGVFHGTQAQLDFVPEHHTDFIFSVLAEEMGFLGSFFLVLLYGALFYQIILLIEKTTDVKGKLLAAGILSILFFQVLINIGMSFGLFPITGITLPFLSYGGSSLVVTFIAIGLLTSVYRERSIF